MEKIQMRDEERIEVREIEVAVDRR